MSSAGVSSAGESVIALRDGTATLADIWTMGSEQPRPTILVRTPYGKRTLFHQSPIDALTAAERGYNLVVQDVRGRGRSEGTFRPFEQEAADGADTVTWITEQSWSDGAVVMTGPSYVGAVQWAAASQQPAGLAAIAPLNSSPYAGEGWTFTNGVRETGFLTSWVCGALAPVESGMRDRLADMDATPLLAAHAFPTSRPWFTAGPEGEYWSAAGLTPDQVTSIAIPVFTVTGWYDIFSAGALRAWRSRALSHSNDRLLVGPWGHDNYFSHLNGDVDLGFSGSGEAVELGRKILDFFDEVLAGKDLEHGGGEVYELGSHRWVSSQEWSGGHSNTITVTIPEAEFVADLHDLPHLSGLRGLRVNSVRSGWGPRDITEFLDRSDVAAIDLPPMSEAVTVSGAVTVRIECGLVPDALSQWVALLCLREPDGSVIAIADGVSWAVPRDGYLEIPLGSLRMLLPALATLTLVVCAGLLPRWERPMSGGGPRRVGPLSHLILDVAPAEQPPSGPGIKHSHN